MQKRPLVRVKTDGFFACPAGGDCCENVMDLRFMGNDKKERNGIGIRLLPKKAGEEMCESSE
ncbi:hypothetical protein [Brevibacillus parabrevis]|uniref:hypothetical protein n=1 Tax=Brevibacillus parabrevis TaxID=54914 RepID=UPI0028D42120|nr:hypothetical protein [Brevibacillus parabrevis]